MVETMASIVARAGPLLTIVAAVYVIDQVAQRDAPRVGLPRLAVAKLTPGLAIAALIGARLAYVAPLGRVFASHPLDLLRLTDGLSMPGGLIGATVGLAMLARRARMPFAHLADLYGLTLPLGVATYNLGCLVRNDCFGRAAPPPFGIVFPGLYTSRYPVELYAAGVSLLIYAALHSGRLRMRVPGSRALAAVTALAVTRLLLDELRLQAGGAMLSADQLSAFGVALAALGALSWCGARDGRRSRCEQTVMTAGPATERRAR